MRFFRPIRQALIRDGKAVRYAAYALGEVLLIVVGILLALQLDNWNQDRVARADFDRYIVQLRSDVEAAIVQINTMVSASDRSVQGARTILGVIDSDSVEGELAEFEEALGNLGKFTRAEIPYGNLRALLDGDFSAIARDTALTASVSRKTGVPIRSQAG